MDWLRKLGESLPQLRATSERKSVVLMHKLSVVDLEVCVPKGILRPRPFWRMDKVDFYHLLADHSIRHTPSR